MIEDLVLGGLWKPVYTSRDRPPLLNLMFADDLILFGEAFIDQDKVIKRCLEWSCITSGQKISYNKSKVFFSKNMS